MKVLSRRSVLAIAAVVDVALHSRSVPVAAKALAARHKCLAPPETLLQGPVHAKILKGARAAGGYEAGALAGASRGDCTAMSLRQPIGRSRLKLAPLERVLIQPRAGRAILSRRPRPRSR
jgi:hypothetical protein